jgi:hypothetical protein
MYLQEVNPMTPFKLFGQKKKRKYPIKRDEEGWSLRARCFGRFEQGQRPAEVAEELKMELPTVCRYFRDWQRLGPGFDKKYAFVKGLFQKTAPDRDKNIEQYARLLRISKEQFEEMLSRPHGLKSFLAGRLSFPIQADAAHKMSVAFELAILISDHLLNKGGKYEDVYSALRRYMLEEQQDRLDEEEDIKKHNMNMRLIHKILEIDLENERLGKVKPDTLSEEELDALLKIVVKKSKRETEIAYWLRIGILESEGLTCEQAREKVYQDLLAKGDLEKAKRFREFQDKVHPPSKNKPETPPPSPQPPPLSPQAS